MSISCTALNEWKESLKEGSVRTAVARRTGRGRLRLQFFSTGSICRPKALGQEIEQFVSRVKSQFLERIHLYHVSFEKTFVGFRFRPKSNYEGYSHHEMPGEQCKTFDQMNRSVMPRHFQLPLLSVAGRRAAIV